MLVASGMFESQAKEVMDMAIPILDAGFGKEEGESVYKLTYDRAASEYPSFLYPLIFERIKPVALQWIDKNKPEAWFREMFVTDSKLSTPAQIQPVPDEITEEKKPAKVSAKAAVLCGIGIMVAGFAAVGYLLRVHPKRQIEKYNRTPRMKKPRKERRQLRRRDRRLDPRSGRSRVINW